MVNIEKRASELGLTPEAMKTASVLEGFAILGFTDEINKIAALSKESEKKEDKKDKKGDKKDLPPFIKNKMKDKDEKEENGKDKKDKEEKGKKGEKKEDKDNKKKDKDEKKDEEKSSSAAAEQFTAGFQEALKEAGLINAAKTVGPYLAPVLGLAGIGTGIYALGKQKKATETTRAGVQRMGVGMAGALGQLAAKQRYNTMRDISNETRLARGMNQNRAALLSHLRTGADRK
jgi:superfamily II DNA/RNA helicase